MTENKKTRTQYYPSDEFDKNVDLQNWKDDGTTISPDYEGAYDEMVKGIPNQPED